MGREIRGNVIRFTDLRLRLNTIANGVTATLERGTDGAFMSESQSEVDLSALLFSLHESLSRRAMDRSEMHRIGAQLGKIAFPGNVEEFLIAEAIRNPVRIRIQTDAELGEIPWELSLLRGFADVNDGFIALSSRVSLTRDIGTAPQIQKEPADLLKVLVAWANPGSARYPALHFVEKEAASVIRALRSAECSSLQIDELPYATIAGLLRSLSERKPEILHVICHGDSTPSGGVLVLEGGMPGTEAVIYADSLAKALVDAGTSLVVLSGCLTSGSPKAIGTQLAHAGIQAVLAMSMPIQDSAAHQFARALYSSLAEGTQLEEAVFEGRCAIAGTGCDWAAPLLMVSSNEPIILSEQDESQFYWQPATRKSNLTYDDRPFIGRIKERADLRRKIRDQGQRLVTITGPGGMGKTRLSKQVAAELLDEFPDGVWFIDCESLIGEQDLVTGIASSLPFATGIESKQSLSDSISRRRTMVVLDCFENSVSQGALIEKLLQNSPNLSILVTSRLVLGIPREHEYPLPPMSLTAKAGEAADSLTLFAEAAGHAVDGFEVTPKNRKLLRELCGSLEGVPLAIVLAAGRLRHMGLAELAQQVRDQPVATLRRRTGGLERHANIESVVAGSFNLLPPPQRNMLCKFGTFVGTFTVSDAAFVCDEQEANLIAWLSDLRDHSLIQIQRDDFRTRYKLLDTVRDYITRLSVDARLASELAMCRTRHAEHYTRRAVEIGKLMKEGRWSASSTMMMQDIGNLRSAMATAIAFERDVLVSQLVNSISRQLFEAGLLTDFRKLADAGYAAADRTGDQTIRIQLLGLDGALASRLGDEAMCEKLWMDRVALCRAFNDMEHCADSLIDLAWQAFENNDPRKSRLRLLEALRLARSTKDFTFIATARIVQARIAFASNDRRLAVLRASQAERLLPLIKQRSGALFVYQNLSISSREVGNLERSTVFSLQLLHLAVERQQVLHVGWALLDLAPIYEQTNQLESSARCYLGAMKVHAEYATRLRARAATAFNQFKKRHPESEVQETLSSLRAKSWLEIVNGLGNS